MSSGAGLAASWLAVGWIVPTVIVLGILYVVLRWLSRRRSSGTLFSSASPEPSVAHKSAHQKHPKECEVYVPLDPAGRSDRDADVHVACGERPPFNL